MVHRFKVALQRCHCILYGVVFHRHIGQCRLIAIGTNIVCCSAVAVYISVAHLSRCTEFYRYLNTDVLTDGKHACAVFNAVTPLFRA